LVNVMIGGVDVGGGVFVLEFLCVM